MTDRNPPSAATPTTRVRLDRWLWAARFFKTRAQAKAAVEGGKVQLEAASDHSAGWHKPKVSKEIAVGDLLEIQRGWTTQVVEITGLSEQRGPASVAAGLYRETPESVEARETESARRRMESAGLRVPQKRPSKRDRRELAKLKLGSREN
jgi:ribosome-associated heat shock protein Hsp15